MKNFLLWLLELLEEDYRGKTGKKALYSGIYKSIGFESLEEFIALSKDERFPPSHTSEWKLVVKV